MRRFGRFGCIVGAAVGIIGAGTLGLDGSAAQAGASLDAIIGPGDDSVQSVAAVAGDEILSNVRGKGLQVEGAEAVKLDSLAIILWDETRGSGTGKGGSRTTGYGNVQTDSLVVNGR